MEYFIGFELSGEVAEYHRMVTERLQRHCNVLDINRKVPPHITFKAPFETIFDEVLEAAIQETVGRFRQGLISVKGFEAIEQKTISLSGTLSKGATKSFMRLMGTLIQFEWMEWQDNENRQDMKFHAPVACHLDSTSFPRVWDYIRRNFPNGPEFKVPFDNVTLYVKRGHLWETMRRYEITDSA